MTATQTWNSIKGTEIKAGDELIDGHTVVRQHAFGRLPEGAQYLDVVLETGEIRRCWEGFLYHVGRA